MKIKKGSKEYKLVLSLFKMAQLTVWDGYNWAVHSAGFDLIDADINEWTLKKWESKYIFHHSNGMEIKIA